MRSPEDARGSVITFYSYKGGTGRSMALANVACLLAAEIDPGSKPVLAIDWDLEAPGLDRFLLEGASDGGWEGSGEHPGLIEYFIALRDALQSDGKLRAAIRGANGWRVLAKAVDLRSFVRPTGRENLHLLGAGAQDEGYPERIASFDWEALYRGFPGVFEAFPEMLSRLFSFVLVDSRTGLTDAGGICTALLPEKLVTVFTPNDQSLSGVNRVTRRVVRFRARSDDLRSLAVFPLPSRVELDEEVLRREWRKKYQHALEETLGECYGLPSLDLSRYLDDVQIPQKGYYAYGEKVAVVEEERRESLGLSTAYEKFALRLVGSENPWDEEPLPARLGAAVRGIGPTPEERLQATADAGEYDVFLSYGQEDAGAARDLAERLEAYGVRPWLAAREIRPGDRWASVIEEGLERSRSVAILVGTRPNEGDHGIVEIARQRGVPMIPVLLEGADGESIPLPARTYQAVDLSGGDEALGRLVWGITGVRPEKL